MSAGAPTEEEWAKAITRASWPDGGHDGFPTRKVAEMIAAHLRPLIDREREAARAEGAASVAGPVLALADEWQSAAQTRTPESLAHEASARALAARVLWESANALRAAIPADATEALARLKAEWQDGGDRG